VTDVPDRRFSRRQFLALGGATLAAHLLGRQRVYALDAQPRAVPVRRLGIVLPAATESMTRTSFGLGAISEAARQGALLASEEAGADAEGAGHQLKLLSSSAPDAAAAIRAAHRLAGSEGVLALIGGFDTEQAAGLALVAGQYGIPFLNIGASADLLRQRGSPANTFHVAASAAMYLDALAIWFSRAGPRSWYVIQADVPEQEAHWQRLREALHRHAPGTTLDRQTVPQGQPLYLDALAAVRSAEPDVVMLLLDAAAQLVFLGQYGAAGLDAPVTGFPDLATQMRDFQLATREATPQPATSYRAALWDTSLAGQDAHGLNERFVARWGRPMNPPAWASWAAVKILSDTINAGGAEGGATLLERLAGPGTVFSVAKGPGVSFRPWDFQLRQPLFIVRPDPEVADGSPVSLLTGLTEVAGTLPDPSGAGAVPDTSLDQLGNGPPESGSAAE
jgi:ABC-type branched-subunit amino acid transport system substrate-binding protein